MAEGIVCEELEGSKALVESLMVKRFEDAAIKKTIMSADALLCQNEICKKIAQDNDYWEMKRDGIPVLRSKQSKFIFI